MNEPVPLVPCPAAGKGVPRAIMLDRRGNGPISLPSQSAGRPPPSTAEESPGSIRIRRRITSGVGRPQGKRHRKQTARSWAARPFSGKARVKGCGQSAPRRRQRRRHGKPRREQNRIGATRGALFKRRRASSVGLAARVGCSRRPATGVPEEWPSRRGDQFPAIQNPAYRPAGVCLRASFKLGQRDPFAQRRGLSDEEERIDAARRNRNSRLAPGRASPPIPWCSIMTSATAAG